MKQFTATLTIFFLLLFSTLYTATISALPLNFHNLSHNDLISSHEKQTLELWVMNPQPDTLKKLSSFSYSSQKLKTNSFSILHIAKKSISPFSQLLTPNKAWGHTLPKIAQSQSGIQAPNLPKPQTYIVIGLFLFATGLVTRTVFISPLPQKQKKILIPIPVPNQKIPLTHPEIELIKRKTGLSELAA